MLFFQTTFFPSAVFKNIPVFDSRKNILNKTVLFSQVFTLAMRCFKTGRKKAAIPHCSVSLIEFFITPLQNWLQDFSNPGVLKTCCQGFFGLEFFLTHFVFTFSPKMHLCGLVGDGSYTRILPFTLKSASGRFWQQGRFFSTIFFFFKFWSPLALPHCLRLRVVFSPSRPFLN